MGNYMHFSQDASQWEQLTQVVWGSHDICPSLSSFQARDVTQSELLALSHAGTWGNIEKPKYNMVYILISPDKTIEWGITFCLVAVWAHPHQGTSLLLGWGGMETCPTHQHRLWLGLHLCVAQWRCLSHTPIQWGAYQHNDRWCANQQCLQTTQPARNR